MKKTSKVWGAVALSLAAIYVFYKKCKKEVKKLEEAEKKTQEELKDLGVSVSKLEKEMIPGIDDDNLVKAMYISMEFGDGDTDIFDPDEGINSYKVIHVRQSTDTRTKRQRLDFMLEIPFEYLEETQGNFNCPRLPDFIRCSKEASRYLSDNFVNNGVKLEQFKEHPKTGLEGYYIFEYRYADMTEDQQSYFAPVKIPDYFYSRYAKNGHNGLTDYIKHLKQEGTSKDELHEIVSYLFYCSNGREISKICIVDAVLYFNISFGIQNTFNPIGINLKTGLECLDWLYDKFRVKRNKDSENEGFKYEHILFHAPDESSKYKDWSILWYYTTDDPINRGANRRVISEDYIY